MTTVPSPHVLHGGKGSVLRFEGGPVTLRRADKEHHIPLAAIALVHADGRSVAIVLTASGADEPTVYRVTEVEEADAAAFADAVTAALPATPASDGAALVTTRALPEPGPAAPARDRFSRLIVRRSAVAAGCALLLGLVVLFSPGPVFAVIVVPVALVGGLAAVLGGLALGDAYRQWRLPGRGVEAVALPNPRRDGWYVYVDGAGRARPAHRWAGGDGPIRVVYDRRDPSKVVVPKSWVRRAFDAGAGVCLVLGGAFAVAGAVAVTVAAFTGHLEN